jgi:adenylate kinase
MKRGYIDEKIDENVEAELIDVILVETLEEHEERAVFEIDTTKMPIPACADVIEEVYTGIRTPSSGIVSWLAGFADEL